MFSVNSPLFVCFVGGLEVPCIHVYKSTFYDKTNRMRAIITSRVQVQRSRQLFFEGMAGGGKTDLADLFTAHRGIVSEKVTERKVRRPLEQSTSFCSALYSLTP